MTTDRPVVREIITKAVCGQGACKYLRSIDLEVPADQRTIQVLGTFISNSALDEAVVIDSTDYGKTVRVKGHYDVHVWYAYEQETRSAKTTVTFTEAIPIKTFGRENISNQQAFAKLTQKPRCRKSYLKTIGNKTVIRVEIEQDLASELVGLTKLNVGIVPSSVMSGIPIGGRELFPPPANQTAGPVADYYVDLKCDEDFPEEDRDSESFQDEYNW